MQFINISACSDEFNTAIKAVINGKRAKRRCWPKGQYIKTKNRGEDQIGIYRDNKLSHHCWICSGREQGLRDWIILKDEVTI